MQEIITYIIIGLAVIYVVYHLIALITKPKSSCGCGGCSCEAKKQFRKKV